MARLTQEQLLEIFNTLKKEVKLYEKGHIKARINIEGKYDLWSEKPDMVILGKQRAEMSFVTLILQSSYVGFYYMPIYCCEEIRNKLSPGLLKLLKGKACFHIKVIDENVLQYVKEAMKVGYEGYRKNGWA